MTSLIDLDSLTLEQKASLLSGHGLWTTKSLPEAGVPAMILADGPHGVRRQRDLADHMGTSDSLPATCFPPAVAIGSSWDPEVAARLGAAVGREARALGVTVVLGPGVNIKRSPLCGRNFEYYSEDPLLSGVLASAYVRALQQYGVGTSVKHYAANNQETDRMRVSAEVDERTMREIYLPAFERVVTEARPATVMCSYNRINGVFAFRNSWLLTDVLRAEWGFSGAVLSDWGAVTERVPALEAGLDLEMPGNGGRSDAEIVAAVRNGELDEAVVNASARRVVTLSGLAAPATDGFDPDAHHAIARELASACAVLLKNEHGVLPLTSVANVAVIGLFASAPRFQGGGSSHINATRVDAALDAIQVLAEARGMSVNFAQGFTVDGSGDSGRLREAAVECALDADVAVVFAGLGEEAESEGFDRKTLALPADQVELIRAVAGVSRRTAVVLSNGGIVSLEGWHDEVDAILEGWLLGQASGTAVADILFGVTNPSGHLAETIPVRLEDNPSYLNFPGEAGFVRYGEGVMVGYRYYETIKLSARYPFGHGLSYTTFETGDLAVTLTGDDSAAVSVTVSNTGERAGAHLVQVYVATGAGPVRRPARELRAFQKLFLEAGESRTVSLSLDRRAFAYYDVPLSRWVVAGGDYTVQIGQSAADIVAEKTVTLAGDDIVPVLSLDSPLPDWLSHPLIGPELVQSLSPEIREALARQEEEGSDRLQQVAMRQFCAFPGVNLPDHAVERMIEISRSAQPNA